MALRGTLTHRKVRKLALYLKIDPCFALGIVEALWHVTGEQQHDGAIGRMDDEDIAMEMFYSGDPGELVAALVKAELLDVHPDHRVIVHDWHIHSDDATDNKITRYGQRYANGQPPRMRRMSQTERDKYGARYPELHNSVRTNAPTCAHDMRTESHEMPLPVPEPVPDPDPVPEKKTKAKAAASAFELPDWIDSGVWHGYEEMRRKIRKPMTDDARVLVVKKLAKFHARGHDPTAVLNQSIENSWQGIFELKPDGGTSGTYKSKTESSMDAAREAIRLIREAGADRDGTDEAGHTPAGQAGYGGLPRLGSGSGLFR